jgi:hypothetical protein
MARVTFVRAGEVVGTIDVDGRPVEAEATQTFVLLIPRPLVSTTEYTLVAADGLSLPIARGEPLGRVVIRVDGKRVGSVGLVAAGAVTAPAPVPSPATSGPPAPVLPLAAEVLVRSGRLFAAVLRALVGAFL